MFKANILFIILYENLNIKNQECYLNQNTLNLFD